jgi:hypothetical protein
MLCVGTNEPEFRLLVISCWELGESKKIKWNQRDDDQRRRRPGRRRMLRTASLSDRPKFTVRKKSVIIGLRDAAGLCNCVHVPLYSTSPPIIIGGPFSFLKDSSATVSKEYWREGKTNGKLPSGVGLAPGTWATLRPIFFVEGWDPICTRLVCG